LPFPRSLREFQTQFAAEDACQNYLARCRWPDGFICPRCGHRKAYVIGSPQLWQCAGCRHQTSVTAGTILHRTKTALTVWFWAAYLMTTDKRGLSALRLQRQLGLGNYETAWMMLHKFRRAMVNVSREPLRGQVEVDDTWIGGTQAGWRGSRQLKGRKAASALAAVEKRGKASGRVRMEVIPDFKAVTILAFLKKHVAPDATVYTDGRKSFRASRRPATGTLPVFSLLPATCGREPNRSCPSQTAQSATSSNG
jgi:transposase-like protein